MADHRKASINLGVFLFGVQAACGESVVKVQVDSIFPEVDSKIKKVDSISQKVDSKMRKLDSIYSKVDSKSKFSHSSISAGHTFYL